jgi:signal transduction histidine kinase
MTLDLRMPGLGGIGVLERAKQIDPDLEVLIITGYGSLDTAVQGLRFRAFDYLPKPFDYTQVRRLIQLAAARRVATRRIKTGPEMLLSTLSHELRTPLNVIMGYSSMLQEDGSELSDEQRSALDRIQQNSNHLLSYVETIFYMAELDRGAAPVKVAPVRIADVLGQVGAQQGPIALAKGLIWRLDAPLDLTLSTDEDKLCRLVRALAENAVRFTTTGEVALVARPSAGAVSIEIRDSGPGLAAELIEETEDTLSGRNASRPPRQLGFGLRLAARLACALGVAMNIASGPVGTTVRLVVPDIADRARATHPATA